MVAAGALSATAQVPPSTSQSAPPPVTNPPLVDLVLSVRERMRLEAQAQRARERLAVLAQEARRLANRQTTVLGELRQLELRREQHAAEEDAALAGARLARSEVARTTARIVELTDRAAARAPAVRARLRRLYALGPLDAPRYWISARNLVDTGRAWRLLATVAARDRDVLETAARDRAALEAMRAEQQQSVDEAERLARVAREAQRAARQAAAAREALLARLTREKDVAARLVQELEQAEHRVRSLLAAPAATKSPAANAPAVLLPLSAFKGDLDWPVEGALLARFGRQRQSKFGTVLPRTGVEIAAAEGRPVAALHEGRIVFADQFAGLGRLVIVDHGSGAFSLYGHLGAMSVQRDDTVARGSRVGTVGRTPSGAEAVYFELRIDGHPVDPLEWLKPATAKRQ
jgi:murein DD-endopeptidase MepM/ murein hydrolase activator NlpD